MNSKLKSLYLMAVGMAAMGNMYQEPLPPRENPIIDWDKAKRNQAKAKGLKQFFINGKEVWALNEKNAIRKAKKGATNA